MYAMNINTFKLKKKKSFKEIRIILPGKIYIQNILKSRFFSFKALFLMRSVALKQLLDVIDLI